MRTLLIAISALYLASPQPASAQALSEETKGLIGQISSLYFLQKPCGFRVNEAVLKLELSKRGLDLKGLTEEPYASEMKKGEALTKSDVSFYGSVDTVCRVTWRNMGPDGNFIARLVEK